MPALNYSSIGLMNRKYMLLLSPDTLTQQVMGFPHEYIISCHINADNKEVP